MANASGIHPILGTMTFGAEGQVKADDVGVLLRSFCGTGTAMSEKGCMLDTARIYHHSVPHGDTEAVLGQVFETFPSLGNKVSVATKADPGMPPHFSLSRQSVIEQCNTSLEKLGLNSVDLFYLHSPDIKTDIEDTLSGVEALHKAGKLKEFGLSNYPAWAVADIWHRCKNRGVVLPTVYQGMYNVITRSLEPEIVPVARELGLRLYVYNPLAGGLLTGRYATIQDITCATDGRFSAAFDTAFGAESKAGTTTYRARYSKAQIFQGLAVLRDACAPKCNDDEQTKVDPVVVEESSQTVNGVKCHLTVTQMPCQQKRDPGYELADVALRWLLHHSLLMKGDGVIIGVSKHQHLLANLAAWRAGPLPPAVLEACDEAWERARSACEPYFHGYGARPGGIERFLALKLERRQEDQTQKANQKLLNLEHEDSTGPVEHSPNADALQRSLRSRSPRAGRSYVGMCFDAAECAELRGRSKLPIVGQALGTLPSNPQQSAQLGAPFAYSAAQHRMVVKDLTKEGEVAVAECKGCGHDAMKSVSAEHRPTEAQAIGRATVFEDLTQRGYFVTSGVRHGFDFVAYEGDPARHHGTLFVTVIDPRRHLLPRELVQWHRLATAARKVVVLASAEYREDQTGEFKVVPRYLQLSGEER